MNFDISTLGSALLAAVLWLALTKIKKLRKALEIPQSDPPPRCLRCEFYRAVKAEFKHERDEITQTHKSDVESV